MVAVCGVSGSVKAAEAISAYAARILEASVASLAFSNCDVKIGMLIATNTPKHGGTIM
jgi:hypothetical protein